MSQEESRLWRSADHFGQIRIGDGAMATLLHQWGVPIRTCYEALSVSMPQWVQNVHRSYLAAGADFIQTNSFGAHRSGLSRYGLERDVVQVNQAAAAAAKTAVREHLERMQAAGGSPRADVPVLVFGTIGSIGGARAAGAVEIDRTHRGQLRSEYVEQMEALIAAGVDGLLLETFADAAEMVFAIEVARSLTRIPILANLSPETVGVTRDGMALDAAFAQMRRSGADVVGLNCRLGPAGILRSFETMTLDETAAYSAVPNAGILHLEDGDYSYTGSADYFADTGVQLAECGVRWIGGCCGTTPEHIRALVTRLASRELLAQRRSTTDAALEAAPAGSSAAADQSAHSAEVVEHRSQRSQLRAVEEASITLTTTDRRAVADSPLLAAVAKRTTVIVELDPPRTLQVERFLAGARKLQSAGADFITMADNSLGSVRVSNMALAALLKQAGIEPLVHVTCRDRNLIGQQSHLMGLDVLGIHHILLVTGDPTRFGDLPGATSVYDVSSIELTRMVKRLNAGTAFSGAPMRVPSRFVVGTSFNPFVRNFDRAVDRLKRKVEAGADYVMTQPVFAKATAERVAQATRDIGVPVFIGVMPLVSYRNALFLHHEVPGVSIPDPVLARLAAAPKDAAAEEGLRVARELLDHVVQDFRGIYLITPFLRHELTEELARYVKQAIRSK